MSVSSRLCGFSDRIAPVDLNRLYLLVAEIEKLEKRDEILSALEAKSPRDDVSAFEGKRVTFDDLELGMILYSVPPNFQILDKDRCRRFVVERGREFVIYSTVFGKDNWTVVNDVCLANHAFYTTWIAALLAAYDYNERESVSLIANRRKITDAIEKEKHESI